MLRVMTSLLIHLCQSAFCIDFFHADTQVLCPFPAPPPESPGELACRLPSSLLFGSKPFTPSHGANGFGDKADLFKVHFSQVKTSVGSQPSLENSDSRLQ